MTEALNDLSVEGARLFEAANRPRVIPNLLEPLNQMFEKEFEIIQKGGIWLSSRSKRVKVADGPALNHVRLQQKACWQGTMATGDVLHLRAKNQSLLEFRWFDLKGGRDSRGGATLHSLESTG